MKTAADIRVPVSQIPLSRQADASVAVVGNPNAGKSTLFNRLTGLRQKIGNYPGVTVERHVGVINAAGRRLELVDLPGTHALSAHSFEETIAVNVLFGRMPGTVSPDAILAVIDSTNLYQGLYLAQQLCEVGLPMVVALTMADVAEAQGVDIDIETLSARLGGVPVCPVVSTTGKGFDTLLKELSRVSRGVVPAATDAWPELLEASRRLAPDLPPATVARLLIDGPDDANRELADAVLPGRESLFEELRRELFGDEPPLAVEARRRYNWVRETMAEVQSQLPPLKTLGARITQWTNRPVPGTLGLFVVMAIVFQAVFAWATPLMDLIDAGTASLNAWAVSALGNGAFASFIGDGIISGVGSVVIFLPQIIILFTFIILLEDSGYLARAAYLLDRAMRSVGLSGQSIIPMISSFACAVPGIMATRVIPDRRDRIATIMAAPFMTCSARLPVYALLIAAFVPETSLGFMNLQGLVLFGLYLFGILMGVLTALLMKKTALRGPEPPFALMLPAFRRPHLRTVGIQLYGRAKAFLYRAGTVIFSVAVIVWFLSYFPRSADVEQYLETELAAAEQTLSGESLAEASAEIENLAAAMQLEQSFLGRAGKFVEPVFRPLGWDWRVSAAVIASFPAREVVVAVLGTVYAVGDEADEARLSQRLRNAAWADGSPIFTLPMVIGLMLFYALCLQCVATLAVIRRETNGWKWPAFAWVYMTSLGYLSALLVYQLG